MNTQSLQQYIEEVSVKYPSVSKKLILEIVSNVPRRKEDTKYSLAFAIQQQLGLNNSYFSIAHKRNTSLKAHVIKEGSFLFVKLDKEIQNLLDEGYICCKITADEVEDFDYTVQFSSQTLLGFYK